MNPKSRAVEFNFGYYNEKGKDTIENNNNLIQNNKKPITFIDTINNEKVEYLNYAGGLDEENLKNGFGILHLTDGSYFKGMFSHGHANGFGIFYHSKYFSNFWIVGKIYTWWNWNRIVETIFLLWGI